MAATSPSSARVPAGTDYRSPSPHRRAGLWVAGGGVVLALVVLVAGVASGGLLRDGQVGESGQISAWAFGLNAVALSTIKLGIAVILIGILTRLVLRAGSIRAVLPGLKAPIPKEPGLRSGTVATPIGTMTVGTEPPPPLFIHRMAKALWAPMLIMGAMVVLGGFVLSLIEAANIAGQPALALAHAAWVQGLVFLGEAMILSGISFLLGSILAGIRGAGAMVQAELGIPVKTLQMPTTGKLFIGLMMLGLVVSVLQFVAYIVVAELTDPAAVAANFAWLGPVREAGLGLLLTGIVLALATIATALRAQSARIVEIITTGR